MNARWSSEWLTHGLQPLIHVLAFFLGKSRTKRQCLHHWTVPRGAIGWAIGSTWLKVGSRKGHEFWLRYDFLLLVFTLHSFEMKKRQDILIHLCLFATIFRLPISRRSRHGWKVLFRRRCPGFDTSQMAYLSEFFVFVVFFFFVRICNEVVLFVFGKFISKCSCLISFHSVCLGNSPCSGHVFQTAK